MDLDGRLDDSNRHFVDDAELFRQAEQDKEEPFEDEEENLGECRPSENMLLCNLLPFLRRAKNMKRNMHEEEMPPSPFFLISSIP
jgi:hypothetical protein